ncbi:MAG: response regulator transcription factor [Blautia sp.]|jgi:DNA-binding response OmpR family regulator
MQRILVVEDDLMLNEGIVYKLKKEGYETISAHDLEETKKMLGQQPDLVILDVNLPDGDSREFLKRLRAQNPVPVIFLTARNTEKDMIGGYDAGGDDYVTKPFSMAVLLCRVKALLKRNQEGSRKFYYSGSLSYDFENGQLVISGETIPLTPTEGKLLEVLLNHRNMVLTREVLLDRVWDVDENFVDEKTLNVNIQRLRKKIEREPGNPKWIRTVFGIGYKWSDGNGK